MAAMLLAFSFLNVGIAPAAQSPQMPIAGKAIPQFMQPLPLLSVQPGGTMATIFGNRALNIHMCEFDAKGVAAWYPCARSTAINAGVGVYSRDTRRTLGRLSNYAAGHLPRSRDRKYAVNCSSSDSADIHYLDQ